MFQLVYVSIIIKANEKVNYQSIGENLTVLRSKFKSVFHSDKSDGLPPKEVVDQNREVELAHHYRIEQLSIIFGQSYGPPKNMLRIQ